MPKQLLSYAFVGGISALVEWGTFALCMSVPLHYELSTAAAFVLATLVNYMLGRRLTFRAQRGRQAPSRELFAVYAVSAIGLLWNLLLMALFVDALAIDSMASKVLSTGLVFFWNFFARRTWIYGT